jgi:hypothetical protein
MTSRWVLVEIEEELPAYRQVGLFCAFQQYPGVVRVTDLQAITRETLDRWLLPAEPAPVKKRHGRKAS